MHQQNYPPPPPKYSEREETVSIMLILTKMFQGTGKIVMLDSGFCVLQVLVDMNNKGVYVYALVKKRT